MKRLICIILLLCCWCLPVEAQPRSVTAKGAVVLDAATGVVLYEKEADTIRSMASTTKIMTTILLLETFPLNKQITVTKEMVTVEGTSMGLMPGDTVTVEGLCYGMMLCSGNDAANTAAIMVAGSLPAFADKMNQKAAALSMRNTHFVTPSGLDHERHYSTPYDMAVLTAYAMDNPTFASIVSQTSARVAYGNPPYMRTVTNHNKLLKSYEGCVGVKTGFTKKSGRCLVSAATKEGATLICVTLSAPDDWNDHKQLLDYGFTQMERVTLPSKTLLFPVVGSARAKVKALAPEWTVLVPGKVKHQLQTDTYGQHFLYAPVGKGQVVGRYVALFEGKPIGGINITAGESVAMVSYTPPFWIVFWDNLKRLLQ